MITLSLAAAVAQFTTTSPFRTVAAFGLDQVRRAADQQAQALLPQFGHPTQIRMASVAALNQQRGGQLDHRGAPATTRPAVFKILKAAAARHQVDPKLVLALSYWESGWDQSKVSVTGAVGLMQVEPPTAAEADRPCSEGQ